MSQSREVSVLERRCSVISSPQMQEKLKQALPPNITLDKFTRTTLTALQTKPELIEADPNSLYNAIIRAAQDGLMPDNRQGAITVFSTKVKNPNGADYWVKKATFMVMVEGCIHKFTKAGIHAYAVSIYENDDFQQWNDERGQHVKHMPGKLNQRGARIGAFACGLVLETGATNIEVMDLEELNRARNASKTADSGPWKEWPERMEQKSALHRLDKRMGTNALTDEEFMGAAAPAGPDSTIGGLPPDADDAPPPPSRKPPTGRPRALQAVVDAEPEQTMPPEAEKAVGEPAVKMMEGELQPLGTGPLEPDTREGEVF